MGEARRLDPKLTIKYLKTVLPDVVPGAYSLWFEGLRKAGLPEA